MLYQPIPATTTQWHPLYSVLCFSTPSSALNTNKALSPVCTVCISYTGTPRTEAGPTAFPTRNSAKGKFDIPTVSFVLVRSQASSIPSPSTPAFFDFQSIQHVIQSRVGPPGRSSSTPGFCSPGASFRHYRCCVGAC